MSDVTVTANDGTQLPLSSLDTTFTYAGDNVQTISVVYPSRQTGIETTYVQTFTYNGSNVTDISQWIAQ
jgi:hypothetical protein